MPPSAFDLYTVGIGPSSSHTVGPMRAAKRFVDGLRDDGTLPHAVRVRAELFGSLGATGHGHGSEKAILLGLESEDPATVDTTTADQRAAVAQERGTVSLDGARTVTVNLVLHRRKSLPVHPNGMTFTAYDPTCAVLRTRTYYSVGGGFVVDEHAAGGDRVVPDTTLVTYPFTTADQLLDIRVHNRLRISDVMLANELAWRSEKDVRDRLLHIWNVMTACVHTGCHREGVLPGKLKVARRAPALLAQAVDSSAIRPSNGACASSARPRTANRSATGTCRPCLASTACTLAFSPLRRATSFARCRTSSRVPGGAIHASGSRPIRSRSVLDSVPVGRLLYSAQKTVICWCRPRCCMTLAMRQTLQ
jgi:iron-sulfur-dependent L-serine dehydratase single chain form